MTVKRTLYLSVALWSFAIFPVWGSSPIDRLMGYSAISAANCRLGCQRRGIFAKNGWTSN